MVNTSWEKKKRHYNSQFCKLSAVCGLLLTMLISYVSVHFALQIFWVVYGEDITILLSSHHVYLLVESQFYNKTVDFKVDFAWLLSRPCKDERFLYSSSCLTDWSVIRHVMIKSRTWNYQFSILMEEIKRMASIVQQV